MLLYEGKGLLEEGALKIIGYKHANIKNAGEEGYRYLRY